MERRDFFRTLIGGVAAAAAVRTWPFRVYSLPTDIMPIALDLENVRDPRAGTFGIVYNQSEWQFKNLSRSPKPFRVGVT